MVNGYSTKLHIQYICTSFFSQSGGEHFFFKLKNCVFVEYNGI